MKEWPSCDGCDMLTFEEPHNRYDVYSAHCCDPEKPVMGPRRTVAVSASSKPFRIPRPKWCRGKKQEANTSERTDQSANKPFGRNHS